MSDLASADFFLFPWINTALKGTHKRDPRRHLPNRVPARLFYVEKKFIQNGRSPDKDRKAYRRVKTALKAMQLFNNQLENPFC